MASRRAEHSLAPVSVTSLRCFLIRIDPFSVQRVTFLGIPFSSHCCATATRFSLTQINISAKR